MKLLLLFCLKGIDINPLCAMVIIWHRIILNFEVLAQKRFIGTWISWVKCTSEKLTGT